MQLCVAAILSLIDCGYVSNCLMFDQALRLLKKRSLCCHIRLIFVIYYSPC